MRSEGYGGTTVTQVNEAKFAGFTTSSGRDITDDLARAHAPIRSPIGPPISDAQIRDLNRKQARAPREPRPPREPAPAPAPAAASKHPGGRPPIDPRGDILRAHRDGLPPAAIVEKLGVATNTVYRHLAKAGLTPHPNIRQRHSGVYPALVDAYLTGTSIGKVADRFGVSDTTVKKALDVFHVVRRNDHLKVGRYDAFPSPPLAPARAVPAPSVPGQLYRPGVSLQAIARELMARRSKAGAA